MRQFHSLEEHPLLLVKAVIFDLDGTLAAFNLDYKTVRKLVKNYLVAHGVPADLLSLDESVFEMLRKTEAWAKSVGKSEEFVDELRWKALNTTEQYELEAASLTNLLPGVVETLKALRGMGLRIGVCTINSEKSVDRIFERFGIASLFDVTVSRNQVRHVKPDPEHLQTALKVLGVEPEETLVVGDSRVDMQSAKALGAVAVGLPTGVSSVEQLMTGGADYVVTEMAGVPLLVERLKKAKNEQKH
jgi:HAD superfamily hydrolase (TIGR01509 family)